MNEGLMQIYPDNTCEAPKQCYADTLITNLKRKQLRAQAELDSVTAALNALNKNPEVANILELISKTGR
jgi:hypothetical protein